MVTFPIEQFHSQKTYREGHCTSFDNKPTDDPTMMNGSKLIEMDTGYVYIYDENGHTWNKFNKGFDDTDQTDDSQDNSES